MDTRQKQLLYQALNMFISALKLDIFTSESVGTDSFKKPVSSGH